MKTVLNFVLLAAVAATPAASLAKGASAPSKAFISQQFQIWNAALKTGNANKVAALYCEPGGVLIPTLSNRVRSTRAEIADYFEHFLLLKPTGQIDQSFVRVLGTDAALDSGLYSFHVVENGKPATVHARYTFVYQKLNGNWCIMEQHSSALPEPTTGSAPHQ